MSNSQQTYLEAFPEIYARRVHSTNDVLEKLASQPADSRLLSFRIVLLSGGYKTLGIGECLLHNAPEKAKQYFYLSAKLRELFFIHYDNGSPIEIDKSHVTMGNYPNLLCALLSDSDELIDSLTHLIGGRPEVEVDPHPFGHNVGYAMKHILLGNYTKAQQHVDHLKAISDDPELEFVLGYAPILQGIIDSDPNAVTKGLLLQLDLHKQDPDHQDLIEEIFSLQVLGLAKLALRRGISVTLDDPLTPAILL